MDKFIEVLSIKLVNYLVVNDLNQRFTKTVF